MRHRQSRTRRMKFSRNTKSRRAMILSLTKSVVQRRSITTTLAKAKCIRPVVEKLITKAKHSSLANRRLLLSWFRHDEVIVDKLFEIGSEQFTRPGGYLRIVRCGDRVGDCAPMAIIQLVQ